MRAAIGAGRRRRLGLSLLLACACRSNGGGGGALARGDADVITRAEISATTASNAYEVVQRLRPRFLNSRGSTTLIGQRITAPLVYLDDRQLGGLSYLRDIDVRTVFEIRFLSSATAQQKYGSGHPAGAILVLSARP